MRPVQLSNHQQSLPSNIVWICTLLFLATAPLLGCDQSLPWPGTIETEIDDLTGTPTGLFRTHGPTASLVVGDDVTPVTIGYWCSVDDRVNEPLTTKDGLFLRIPVPDTMFSSDEEATLESLFGAAGLLEARMAVDGETSLWKYSYRLEPDALYREGNLSFVPPDGVYSMSSRDTLTSSLILAYGLKRFFRDNPPSTLSRQHLLRLSFVTDSGHEFIRDLSVPSLLEYSTSSLASVWPVAEDYVASHYRGRDSLAVELSSVVKFSLEGFDAASDSVRSQCPVSQSHHEWNELRDSLFVWSDCLDALQGRSETNCRVPANLESN